MKTVTSLALVAFLLLLTGCSEVAVDPIVAENPAKATPTFHRIILNDDVELIKSDESVEMVTLTGEITYQLMPRLSKTLPAKPVYVLQMSARGEIAFSVRLKKESLAKPETFEFTGSLTNIVEEDGEFIANFTLCGVTNAIGHVHLGFVAVDGQLTRGRSYADFHELITE